MICQNCGHQNKNLKSDVGAENNVRIAVYAADDLICVDPLLVMVAHNKVPLSGRRIIRDLIARGVVGTGQGYAPTHMAVGSDGTGEDDSDELLGAEVFRAPVSYRRPLSSGVQIQLFLSDQDANGNTLREAGMFDSVTGNSGNMFARVTFDPVVKTTSVKVVIYWTITITS